MYAFHLVLRSRSQQKIYILGKYHFDNCPVVKPKIRNKRINWNDNQIWEIISPVGASVIINGNDIPKFCKDNNLRNNIMKDVAAGNVPMQKGWTIKLM